LGDWFPLRIYDLTSKASPNDSEIVIIVIIIAIGEAHWVSHMGGIIAQTIYLRGNHTHFSILWIIHVEAGSAHMI
jgi:hypothetical protein